MIQSLMLRITVHESPEELRFALEGSLSGPWVDEFERCWRERARPGGRLCVDLQSVDFIDDAGRALLALLHAEHAAFCTSQPWTRGLVDDIIQGAGSNPI